MFKTSCIICFISAKCHLFHNFIIFYSNNTVTFHQLLNLNIQPCRITVNQEFPYG